MGSYITATPPGKKIEPQRNDVAGYSKPVRIARSSLHDLIVFYEALEDEMSRMMSDAVDKGTTLENMLYDKMVAVKEKYLHVMRGLTESDYGHERLALIKFADAVQDLMSYIHAQRRH